VSAMGFVFIYIYWRPTRFSYERMLVSFTFSMTDATSEAETDFHSGTPECTANC